MNVYNLTASCSVSKETLLATNSLSLGPPWSHINLTVPKAPFPTISTLTA